MDNVFLLLKLKQLLGAIRQDRFHVQNVDLMLQHPSGNKYSTHGWISDDDEPEQLYIGVSELDSLIFAICNEN